MKIEYVLLAEGLAHDARGALTLVGLNQNVFSAVQFPAQTKRVIVGRISDLQDQDNYLISTTLADPHSRVLAVQSGQFNVTGPSIASIPPGGVDIPMEFTFAVTGEGVHKFTFELTHAASGEAMREVVELYVVPPSELGAITGVR